jgi:hypothetical protein
VIEMKLWMGNTGNPALAGIIADIGKLQQLPGARLQPITSTTHRIMLVFSENPQGQTTANLNYLAQQLSLTFGGPLTPGQNFEVDSFSPTYSDWPAVSGVDMEFG